MVTLKTLAQATDQEVFDQVATHLLVQGVAAKSKGVFGCMYRNPEGLKCAAGCLIADDEYKPEMEGNTWTWLVNRGLVPPDHEHLIHGLQTIHDGLDPALWPEAVDRFAKNSGFEMTTVRNSVQLLRDSHRAMAEEERRAEFDAEMRRDAFGD